MSNAFTPILVGVASLVLELKFGETITQGVEREREREREREKGEETLHDAQVYL